MLAIFLIWSGIAIWRSTNLKPLSKAEEFLPAEHWSMQGWKLSQNAFNQGNQDEKMSVDLYFGADHIDKTEASLWDPNQYGDIVWNEDFTLAPKANQ